MFINFVFNSEEHEKSFGWDDFHSALEKSGIFVSLYSWDNTILAGTLERGIMRCLAGDKEGIMCFYKLWLAGYRGGDIDDGELQKFIDRAPEKERAYDRMDTGIQGV